MSIALLQAGDKAIGTGAHGGLPVLKSSVTHLGGPAHTMIMVPMSFAMSG